MGTCCSKATTDTTAATATPMLEFQIRTVDVHEPNREDELPCCSNSLRQRSKNTDLVELKSSDGLIIKVLVGAARKSKVIDEIIATYGSREDQGDCLRDRTDPIPVRVQGTILNKIFEWAEYHKDDGNQSEKREQAKTTLEVEMEKERRNWDHHFLHIDDLTLLKLLEAAHYLEVQELVDLICSRVATLIRGKTPEYVRQRFGIFDDFKKKESKQLTKEDAWSQQK